MRHIIKSEFYKVRKSRVTFVTAICLLAICGLELAFFIGCKLAGGDMAQLVEDTRGIEQYAGFGTGTFYLVFVAIFIGGMVSGEYTNRTVRQVVSRGESKLGIALGQYIALSTAMTVITMAVSAVLGVVCGLIWQFGSISIGRFFLLLLGQIAGIWSYSAICMLLAHITRSGGLSIGLNVMLLLGGNTMTSLLSMWLEKEWISKYWLLNVQYEAINYTGSVAGQGKNIAILAGVAVVFTILGILCFQKRDID